MLTSIADECESLDYDECENFYFLSEERIQLQRRYYHIFRFFMRWCVILLIGVLTGCTAVVIVLLVDQINYIKIFLIQKVFNQCGDKQFCVPPFLLWAGFNMVFVAIGSTMVAFLSPVSAGSGIPVIKCYLNGIKVPEVVRFNAFLVKSLGVVCSVVGGLIVGKEGPLIHCGSVIAAGVSQGKTTTFKKDFHVFQAFRNDHEKRDFVSAGAAAGVSAAFGAPIGGVLFSLEEGASFWNQALTWRIFFCSMISSFTLNFLLSLINHHSELYIPGLVNFSKFGSVNYDVQELPFYALMGLIGGLLGALFNFLNYQLTKFRIEYIFLRWAKVLEAIFVSFITATIGFLAIVSSNDCNLLKNDDSDPHFPITINCPDKHYSVMGTLWLSTPESALQRLFASDNVTWSTFTLFIFFILYFFLSFCTYGLSVPSGLFIPSLALGASWGLIIQKVVVRIFPKSEIWASAPKFALIGAAASLGGIVRMTLSLTVILMEATGNITFGLPIMVTLIIAKWVGDYFCDKSIYDRHISISKIPFLPWEPPLLSSTVYASEVMSYPVVTFETIEVVGNIIDKLSSEKHNGFPVVDYDTTDSLNASTSCEQTYPRFGRFRGLVLRSQLIMLLKHRIFNELDLEKWPSNLSIKTFRDAYPRYPTIENVVKTCCFTQEERNMTVDLRPIMNPSAFTVSHAASLNRIFKLSRGLGLRHVVVLNDCNEVVGIVTRKDLARYKPNYSYGIFSLRQLKLFKS